MAGREGRLAPAYQGYVEILNDRRLPKDLRAAAACEAGLLAESSSDENRAEFFHVKCREIDPDRKDNRRLELFLRKRRGEVREALEIAEALLLDAPLDIALHRIRASLLVEDARPEEGLEAAKRAHQLATFSSRVSVKEKVKILSELGMALYRCQRPDEAVRTLKDALALDPEDPGVHRRIAELVLPSFADPERRRRIDEKFREANATYQAGAFERTRQIALEVLRMDEDEGLAHKLVVFADERLKELERERRRGESAIAIPLRAPEDRTRLVARLSEICAGARVGSGGDRRPGEIRDLFPDWDILTTLQQATIAHAALPYGRLIPRFIERGLKYRLVLPATSAPSVDPFLPKEKRKAFGRYHYSARGFAYHTKSFVVSGVETIDAAARGGYNTIAHELAHVVHFFLRDCWNRVQKNGDQEATEEERRFARAFEEVESLFQESKARGHGQALYDAYSGANVWEYFAQGMGAYLSDRNAPKLYARNPRLFELLRSIVHDLASFPPGVAPPEPYPVTHDVARRGPFQIDRLRREARTPWVRSAAESLWLELEVAYGSAPRGRGGARPLSVGGGGESEELEGARLLRSIFSRAGDLALIDEGIVSADSGRRPSLGPNIGQFRVE